MTARFGLLAAGCTAVGMLHDLFAPLVLVGLALLVEATRRARAYAGAAWSGWAVAFAGTATIAGGGVGLWPALPLAAPLVALPFALPGLLHHHALRRGRAGAADAILALAWLTVEAALVHLAGLPFLRVGYAVAGTPLAALAGLAGAGTVSAGAWAVAIAVALAARRPRPGATPGLARVCVVAPALAAAAGLAAWTLGAAAPASGAAPVVRVALVQTDVRAADARAAELWPEARAALGERTADLLRRAAATGAELVVAPEGALHLSHGSVPMAPPARHPDAPPHAILAGAVVAGGGGPTANAVVDLADGARVVYEKQHPVPVAERRFAPGGGSDPVPLGDLRIAAAICYDLLFAREIRRGAADADLLVAVSDAAFAGRSALPFLHLGVARLRAAETGRPLLFVTATGPSAVVDPLGRVAARSGRFRPEVLVAEVAARRRSTPYARFGLEADGLATAALALVAARRGVRPLAHAVPRRP